MFIVFLRFSRNSNQAARFMDGHNAWIRRGFDDGVFLMTGSLQPATGGAILANGVSHDDLRRRLDADPFVAEDVVETEIVEIAPGRVDPRLTFLLD